jgi:PAS domain S-box-containing protein
LEKEIPFMSNENYCLGFQHTTPILLEDTVRWPLISAQIITLAEIKTLLDFSPDALVLIDAMGTIVQVNEWAATMFGYTRSELKQRPLELLLPEQFHEAQIADQLNPTGTPRPRLMGEGLDMLGQRKDGSELPVNINLYQVQLEQVIYLLGAIHDISIQYQRERERVQQIEQLKLQGTLINLAHDAILVRDQLNRILSWNSGAEELYGWSEKEVLGRVSHTLLQTRFPTSRADVEAQLAREVQWEGDLVHTHRDNHMVVVESRQVLIRDSQGISKAILEIDRDITKRKIFEQVQTVAHTELLSKHTFLQQLLDILPNSIYVVHGQEARLVLANRATASIWKAVWPPGQSMHDFLDEHAIRIVNPSGDPIAHEDLATMRALLRGETVQNQQEMIRQPSGESLPVMVNAVPLFSHHWRTPDVPEPGNQSQLPQHGEPLALVIHQDIHLLKEADYLKDEFIGIAAHELRQPLSLLKGAVETLLLQTKRGHGSKLASWQLEMLEDLGIATIRLTQLTDDLLDVSRLQADQLKLRRLLTDLIPLSQRIVTRLQKTTTRHYLTFHTDHPQLGAMVDPQRIEQVLSNLLINAIKYSPQGGSIHVTLTIPEGAQEAEIRVRDEGLGIPVHQHARIFGRFMRADNAQAAGINGTGLGLYLCHALVERHAGRIWFESEEGAGTTFFIRLPLLAPD